MKKKKNGIVDGRPFHLAQLDERVLFLASTIFLFSSYLVYELAVPSVPKWVELKLRRLQHDVLAGARPVHVTFVYYYSSTCRSSVIIRPRVVRLLLFVHASFVCYYSSTCRLSIIIRPRVVRLLLFVHVSYTYSLDLRGAY